MASIATIISTFEVGAQTGFFRAAWRFARFVLIGYLLVLLAMTFFETWLVYPVPPVELGNWQPTDLEFEDVSFESGDGTRLHGWFLPHREPRFALVYCHGNGEHVALNAESMDFLRNRLEASVLIFDYRGYGRSEGSPHEAGLIADGIAAQRWLADRINVPPDEIVLVGRSIGGAVCVAMAAELGAKALVLESTFSRMTDVAARHFPWLPVKLLMRNRFDSLARIQRYNGPVLQSHGTVDDVVPIQFGRRLFDAIPSDNKGFLELPGLGHNDMLPESYYTQLVRFLNQNVASH